MAGRPAARPAPIAASAAASSASPGRAGGPRSRATRSIRPISAGCAQGRRARRDPGPGGPPAPSRDRMAARVAWDAALDHVAGRVPAHVDAARAGGGRLLRLRPAPDRGLLRRQQAGQGLHRHRRTSTPTRACAWPRPWPATSAPSAPTRCPAAYDDLEEADLVRARRLQPRLVPSRPVPAPAGRQASARPELRVVMIDPRRTATARVPTCTWR